MSVNQTIISKHRKCIFTVLFNECVSVCTMMTKESQYFIVKQFAFSTKLYGGEHCSVLLVLFNVTFSEITMAETAQSKLLLLEGHYV